MTVPELSESYRVWLLMSQVHNAMERVRENELRPLGISLIQAAVLWFMARLDRPASPAELAAMLFRKHHSVSGLLRRMEGQGLIERPPDLQRAGVVRVVITEKGRETLLQLYTTGSAIDGIMACLSSNERAALRSYLEALRENAFSKLVEKPPAP